MKEHTINEVSKQLMLSKATLRYYDQLGIISPKRAENGYRYYTDQDMLNLRYVEVMKFSNFSLAEIRQVLGYITEQKCDKFPELLHIIGNKQTELSMKIKLYRSMLEYLEIIEKIVQEKTNHEDMLKVDELIYKIFEDMRGDKDE